MTWDTTLLSGAPTSQSVAVDHSQWSVTTGRDNSTAGGARVGVPSAFETVSPAVAAATYGGASKSSLLPMIAIGAGVLVLVLVLAHRRHK
jgi:hypothetical protein